MLRGKLEYTPRPIRMLAIRRTGFWRFLPKGRVVAQVEFWKDPATREVVEMSEGDTIAFTHTVGLDDNQ